MHESFGGSDASSAANQGGHGPIDPDAKLMFEVPADARALAPDRDRFLQEIAMRRPVGERPTMLRRLLPDRDDRLAAGLAVLVGGLALMVLLVVGSNQTGSGDLIEGPTPPTQT